ncbi:hypothetical protein HG531_008538 [Fusarium graminearum]|nr:hypothetical protein HG531_008538 [Fusarium graminearum]
MTPTLVEYSAVVEAVSLDMNMWSGDLRSSTIRDTEDVLGGMSDMLEGFGIFELLALGRVAIDDGDGIIAAIRLVKIEKQVSPSSETAAREIDTVSTFLLSLFDHFRRDLEVVVSISKVGNHLLLKCLDGSISFVLLLAIPEIMELLGQSSGSVGETEASLGTDADLAA